MPELKINMSETTHHTLLKLANSSGDTIQEILDKAIENYRRNLFLVQANESFLILRNNETLWQEEIAEREAWDQTLPDGIEKDLLLEFFDISANAPVILQVNNLNHSVNQPPIAPNNDV